MPFGEKTSHKYCLTGDAIEWASCHSYTTALADKMSAVSVNKYLFYISNLISIILWFAWNFIVKVLFWAGTSKEWTGTGDPHLGHRWSQGVQCINHDCYLSQEKRHLSLSSCSTHKIVIFNRQFWIWCQKSYITYF